jgi:1,2-phenylacetyl-CoA epoxidase PaaB subunit
MRSWARHGAWHALASTAIAADASANLLEAANAFHKRHSGADSIATFPSLDVAIAAHESGLAGSI